MLTETNGGFVGRMAARVYAWSLMRSLKRLTLSNEWSYDRTLEIIDREMRSIGETVVAVHNYQKTESAGDQLKALEFQKQYLQRIVDNA